MSCLWTAKKFSDATFISDVVFVRIIIIVIVLIAITRGFPVTSLSCNDTVAEVWNTNLKVVQHYDGCDEKLDDFNRCKHFV